MPDTGPAPTEEPRWWSAAFRRALVSHGTARAGHRDHNGGGIRRYGMSFLHGIQEMMPSGNVGGALRACAAVL